MKSIEIETAQNIVIQFELAGFIQRALAFLIDSIILFILWFIFILITGNAFYEIYQFGGAPIFILSSFIVSYFFVFESLNNGQSIGKLALGIRVISADGSSPKYYDLLIRNIFILFDVLLSLGAVGFLFIASTEKSQRIGDLIAQTLVIKITPENSYTLKDVLKISKSGDFTPEFPEIVKLTDDDILFIKNVISRYKRKSNEINKQIVIDLVDKIEAELGIVRPQKEKHIPFLNKLITEYVHLTR